MISGLSRIAAVGCIAVAVFPAAMLLVAPGAVSAADAPQRPNILCILGEDINPNLGCYGDSYATTPEVDRLASRGMRYVNCWSTAPVCAPARTSMISGIYPTASGAEHMRSLVSLPQGMKMFPQLLREHGYYCVNNSKEDYNLRKTGRVWDESSATASWRNRAAGQPFLAMFHLLMTHESQIRAPGHTLVHDPAKAPVPPYQPDTPEVRHDWAQYYDQLTVMDRRVGALLRQLDDDGLAQSTVVLFFSDHGCGMPRHKRLCYNSGLHVPMIVYVPEKFRPLVPGYQPGGVSQQLVCHVDIAPTLLSLAGVPASDWMQGHAFLGEYAAPPQPYIHGFRGRMDERIDLQRAVRNQRYVYIRNYMPHLIYGQHVAYMFQTPTTQVWKQLYDAGKLKPPQTFFWERKPPEELYDLQNDADEVQNLAASPEHQAILRELRIAQREHAMRIRDVGFLPEAEQHRRCAGITPYELGHDAQKYPLEKILAMADLASGLAPDAVPQLTAGLQDGESGVRYWAALGLRMRGAAAVDTARAELRAALADECPSVRVAAAGALGLSGNEEDLELVLPVLKGLVAPESNGVYLSIEALNVVDALGPKAAPLLAFLKTIPRRDPAAPASTGEYVPRLLESILGETAGTPKKGPSRKKAKS